MVRFRSKTKRVGALLALFVGAFSGCSHSLREDVVMPAMDANYLSAEFTACGQHFVGSGICALEAGHDLSEIALAVQGYYQGTVKFKSTCRNFAEPPESSVYVNSESIPYSMQGSALVSCGVSFVVSPQYPNQYKAGLIIHSFEGQLYIKVYQSGILWNGFSDKVVAGVKPSQFLKVPAGEDSNAEFLFDGCGITFDQTFSAINGFFFVPLAAVLPSPAQKTCVMSGAYWLGGQAVRLSWMIDGYNPKFLPLPIPKLIQSGKNLSVQADENTSIIALDREFQIDNKASFKFDANIDHTLRVLTIGGRSVVGDYSKSGGWKWML